MKVEVPVKHVFNVSLTWNKEKHFGVLESENRMPLRFTPPVEFGGSASEWSPEHMLAASLSSCYTTTFSYFTKLMKVNVTSFDLDIRMIVEKDASGPFVVKMFLLYPRIKLGLATDADIIDNLLAKVKKYCIISSAMKPDIIVEPTIVQP